MIPSYLAETTTEEPVISFGQKIPAEIPTEPPSTVSENSTIPFADEISTTSTTVEPSPEGDLETKLFDTTPGVNDLEKDLFDTTMMPDVSKSTTEKIESGKFKLQCT